MEDLSLLKDESNKQLTEKPTITFAGVVKITLGAIAIVAALKAFSRNLAGLNHLEKVIKPNGSSLVKVLAVHPVKVLTAQPVKVLVAQPVITSASAVYASAAAIIAGLGVSCMSFLTNNFLTLLIWFLDIFLRCYI